MGKMEILPHCMNCAYEHTCSWKPAGKDDACQDWRADLETENGYTHGTEDRE